MPGSAHVAEAAPAWPTCRPLPVSAMFPYIAVPGAPSSAPSAVPSSSPTANQLYLNFISSSIHISYPYLHACSNSHRLYILFYSILFHSILFLYICYIYHHILLSPDQLNHNTYSTTSASCIYFICKINIIILTFQLKAVVLVYACPISLLLLDVL